MNLNYKKREKKSKETGRGGGKEEGNARNPKS